MFSNNYSHTLPLPHIIYHLIIAVHPLNFSDAKCLSLPGTLGLEALLRQQTALLSIVSPIGGYLIGLAPNPGVSYELLSLSVSEARGYLEICSCPIRLVTEQPWCILVVSRAGRDTSESPVQGRAVAQQPHCSPGALHEEPSRPAWP